jgi:hypothetical protein
VKTCRAATNTPKEFGFPLTREMRIAMLLLLVAVVETGCVGGGKGGAGNAGGKCLTCPQALASSMTAVIDGKPWTANPTQDGSITATYSTGTHPGFLISGVNVSPNNGVVGYMTVLTNGAVTTASYVLSAPSVDADLHESGGGAGFVGASTWATDSDHVGTLTITKLDVSGGWVEGHFEYDAIDHSSGAVVHVRTGGFACKLDVVHD